MSSRTSAPRFRGMNRFGESTPHIALWLVHDMRHTLGKSTRQAGSTTRGNYLHRGDNGS